MFVVRRSRWVAATIAAALLLPTAVAADDTVEAVDDATSDINPDTPRAEGDIAVDLDETEDEEEDLSEQIAELEALVGDAEENLAIIGARLEDARDRLEGAEAQVALAEAALAESEQARDDAIERHTEARQRLAETEEELDGEEQQLAINVSHTYKFGSNGTSQGAAMLELVRRAEDPNALAHGMKHLQVITTDQARTVTRVNELRAEHAAQAAEANDARRDAIAATAEARDFLSEVEALREAAIEIAEQIEHEERLQRQMVAELRDDRGNIGALLERVEQRKDLLLAELAARRAAVTGAGGGPDIPGGYCPVEGAVVGRAFINDWGFPRSGGRRHQGNDIFADEGTPIIAIQDGVVTKMDPPERPTNLGGITVTYRGDDGSLWYNAHLETITPGLKVGDTIEAGEQIGTVGKTGNARTTPPHNHIQRQWNGVWVNPFPTIAVLCRGD